MGKRRAFLVAVWLSVFALLVGACGADDEPEAAPEPADDPAEEEPAEEEPAEDEPAEEEPADDEVADEEPPDHGTVVVINGITQTFEFLPQQLGHDLGVWERRGVTPDDVFVAGGGQVGQTIAAGEGDVALTTGSSALGPILGGHWAPIIGEVGREFTLMVMCVGEESDAQGPEDMQGATIGITSPGSGTDFLAESLAESQGWEVGVDLEKAPIGGLAEQVAALERGTTDGFIWTAEACFQLEEQGDGRVVFSFGDIVENNVFEVIVGQGSSIEERPEAIEAYLEGWYETTQWMKDNREDTIQWMVDNWDLSESVAENTYDLDIDNLSTDGTIPQENLEGLAESLVTVGQVDSPPPVEDFWDDRFVPVSFD